MIKRYLNKIVALAIVVTSVLMLGSIGASAEWKQDSTGWWYTEGNSYNKNCWSLIDGKWYYFDYSGYMKHDTIIDGYYLNSSGVCVNSPSEEIKKYESLLSDENWIKRTTNKNSIFNIIILDLNKDGVSEMLFNSDGGSGAAGQPLFVITYDDSNVNVEQLPCSNGGYYGYSSSENIFFICGGNHGVSNTVGYKLENNHCVQVYSCMDDENRSNGNAFYYLNGQNVSKTEYIDSFKKFGKIEKSPIQYDGMYTANID